MKIKALILSGLVFALAGCGSGDSNSNGGSKVWVKIPASSLGCAATRVHPLFEVWAEAACVKANLRYADESRCAVDTSRDIAEALCVDS